MKCDRWGFVGEGFVDPEFSDSKYGWLLGFLICRIPCDKLLWLLLEWF
jgi:hypothetical protein